MPQRFVIHQHTGHGQDHYDLMIAAGEVLATWQFTGNPTELADAPLPCRRIQDHRTAYLDYEGPISRGRGKVRAVDRGESEVLADGQAGWRVKLTGEKLAGVFDLTPVGPGTDACHFRRAPQD